MKKHNISAIERKKICGDFTFDFSMLIDQGEISDALPRVTFYKDDENELYFGSSTFAFHEYAFGNTDTIFEEETEE